MKVLFIPRPPAFARKRSSLAASCRRLQQAIFNSYRPELHYMRGPGPRSREKHAIERSVRGNGGGRRRLQVLNAVKSLFAAFALSHGN